MACALHLALEMFTKLQWETLVRIVRLQCAWSSKTAPCRSNFRSCLFLVCLERLDGTVSEVWPQSTHVGSMDNKSRANITPCVGSRGHPERCWKAKACKGVARWPERRSEVPELIVEIFWFLTWRAPCLFGFQTVSKERARSEHTQAHFELHTTITKTKSGVHA